MTIKRLVPTLLLATVLGACTSLLEVAPVDEISEEIAIVDETSARAALIGAYAALESGSYYGGSYLMWTETLTDNVEHTGTFEGYADADGLVLRADMSEVPGIWYALYEAISAANLIMQRVPEIEGLDPDVEDEILGQAHALRALHYFNLVRAWGDVPLVLTPAATLEEAAQVSRAPVASVNLCQYLPGLRQSFGLHLEVMPVQMQRARRFSGNLGGIYPAAISLPLP